VLELTALPTVGAERWVPWVREADVIFPHLDAFPQNALADAERWAADIDGPAYAIDEQTAIKVVDGSVEVVSEGQWTKFGS
ncbi:MAG: peptidase E, partial [Nocardioidaceae bacterium]